MNSNQLQELTNSGESSIQRNIYQSFAAVATTEGHALTYIGMCLEQGPFSRSDMRRLFTGAQGRNPAWIPSSNLNYSYAEDRFVPSGIAIAGVEVRKVRNRKEPVEVAVVEPIENRAVIAACGRLLEYSLLPDSLPLRTVFGESREKGVGVQSAVMRRQILHQLDKSPGLSEVELARRITDDDQFPMSIFLLDLFKNGVLIRQHSSDWDERVFILTGRSIPIVGNRRYETNKATTALYNATDILAASGQDSITASDLFDFTCKVDPDVDTTQLRQAISLALVGGESYNGTKQTKFLQSVDAPGSLKGGELTKYEISPDYRDDLHDLLQDLEAILDGDGAEIDYWENRAIDIYVNPELVNQLVSKAATNSPHKNNLDDSDFVDKISQLISEQGPSTVRELEAFLQQNGVKMGLKGIDEKIRKLTKAGKIEVNESPLSERNTRLVKRVVGIVALQATLTN